MAKRRWRLRRKLRYKQQIATLKDRVPPQLLARADEVIE
jgi:hypothetical protein